MQLIKHVYSFKNNKSTPIGINLSVGTGLYYMSSDWNCIFILSYNMYTIHFYYQKFIFLRREWKKYIAEMWKLRTWLYELLANLHRSLVYKWNL